MKPTLLVALLAMPVMAQNSDLAVLFGWSPQNKLVRDFSLRQSNQSSFQVNYAWQLREGPAGRLYIEMPVVVIGGTSEVIDSSSAGFVGARAFYVPGLRNQYSFTPRLSAYAAGGAGVQVHHLKLGLSGGQQVVNYRFTRAHFAMDAGAGLDLRLSRLLSVRGEVRDFVGTERFLNQRHNINWQMGLALHF